MYVNKKRVAAETVQSENFAIVVVCVEELVGTKCISNPRTLWFLQHWSFSELTENSIDSNKEITARAIIDARASCGVDPVFALRRVLLVNSDAQLWSLSMWYRCRSVNAFVRQLKLEKNKMSYFNSPDHYRGMVVVVGETTLWCWSGCWANSSSDLLIRKRNCSWIAWKFIHEF